ncbi:MAG: DUF4230 domain-containing protein [Lachnospiraceae bacterium]|nr:DUF4230 domain-containing protein [Lachnospiraceae bacterium]
MKNKIIKTVFIALIVAIIVVVIIGVGLRLNRKSSSDYSDGVIQIGPNTIYLEGSGVEVNFSEVLLSNQKEQRKLIVSEQEAKVETELTDRLIKSWDYDFLKKTQKVSYEGKGYFVVDLDNITEDRIVDDKDAKTVTILIDHSRLEVVDIDPNKVSIGEVKEGFLARGDIELTLKDYNEIEKELKKRMEEKFNTVSNGQTADDLALKMVKEVYEPIVKAIDAEYEVVVAFK